MKIIRMEYRIESEDDPRIIINDMLRAVAFGNLPAFFKIYDVSPDGIETFSEGIETSFSVGIKTTCNFKTK